ncbi:MAG: ABC transporter ATP-binding protein [Deltaproteobacteria bacterium]
MTTKRDIPVNYVQNSPVEVQIAGLAKSFGANRVLNGVNLEIKPAETMVILGKSGSGKSVLLRHIIGLEKPDSGEILIGGIDAGSPRLREAHRLAMVFQSSALFNSLSVKENVALYLRENAIFADEDRIGQVVSNALSIVGLEGKEAVMPSDLSGGMRKRVAIARALVMSPDLILFDEPTAELDPLLTRSIGDVILGLRDHVEVTQIVVTHDIDLAFYIADRIALINEGRIVEVAEPRDFKISQNPVARAFIQPQFERAL